jgi:glycine hydroxymethyltransferase
MVNNQIQEILKQEILRQHNTVELIASENFASEAVRNLCGSVFTNKYAEGYPGKRYYNGCEHMDSIEQLAIDEACKLFDCQFANVQPHSGANANSAVYQALMKPGDVLLGMSLSAGGHLSHGSAVNMSGKFYDSYVYGVDSEGKIDMEGLRNAAHTFNPKVIVAGASAYPGIIDWKGFRKIADEVGAFLVADMSHYSGLVAGGAYPSPLPHADVVTSTTHKTLRGPRGGIILWNNPEFTRKINSAIFPGTQGGPLMHIIAAKAQCFIEANTPEFKDYSRRVIANAKIMCEVFVENGFKLLTGGTDCHIILMDLTDSKHSGREAADLLEENGITVNKNSIPGDKRSFVETSGIRMGTAAETTRTKPGKDEAYFSFLAQEICNFLK